VKKFGILFAAICTVVGAYLFYKESSWWPWFAFGAALFVSTGLLGYSILRPAYIGWMKFALALGWINTRILLGIFFYLIVTPIALFMRVLGKDILDQKIDRSARTYWKKRERTPFDPKRMEHQF
jgi:hypothetical protein